MFGCYNIKQERFAYTLAEMLMVLAILALMMLAMPPMTKKLFKIDTAQKKHGRLECYYNSAGNLVQYEVSEGNEPTFTIINDPNEGCKFYAPSNALYLMIHVVGGGGAGMAVDEDPTPSLSDRQQEKTAMSYLSSSAVGLWPDWFAYLMQHRPSGVKFNNSNSFEILKMYKEQEMPFGFAGQAGERVSMFFPQLDSSTQIILKPGKGGTTGATDDTYQKGDASVVQFKYKKNDGTFETQDVITAAGGESGKKLGDGIKTFTAELSGGNATDFGIGDLQIVRMKTSTFEDVLENAKDSDNKMNSMINEPLLSGKCGNGITDSTKCWSGGMKAGWGGNGGYYYLSGSSVAGEYSYLVNNPNQSIESGLVERTNHWTFATQYIPKTFYRRNGTSGACELKNKPYKVRGYCVYDPKSLDSEAIYYCNFPTINYTTGAVTNYPTNSIKQLATNYTETLESDYSIKFTCNSTNCSLDTYNLPEGFSAKLDADTCEFDRNGGFATCETSSDVDDSYYECSSASTPTGGSDDGFTCPDGVTKSQKDGYGVCNSNNGGNGAIIIIW